MPFVLAQTAFSEGKEISDCLIEARDGVIVSVRPVAEGESVPEDTLTVECLAPGFIDIQLNGGEEYHFTATPTIEALRDMDVSSRRSGTPFLMPTCITSSWENIRKAIKATADFRKHNPDSGVLGIHIEGPYISPEKKGAHPLSLIQVPSDETIAELVEAARELPVLLTIAPEVFSDRQLETLLAGGVILAAGHSNATYDQGMKAFGAGIRLCTHLFNAMSGFGHRDPGLVGAVFNSDQVYAPIILDGIHCNFGAAKVAYRQKGEKLLLISDALFLGRKRKEFHWGEFEASLVGDRYVTNHGNLAGGAISMGDAVVNAVRNVGIPLPEAIEMATERPAIVLKYGESLGKLAPGFRAVFTTFTRDLEDFKTLKI